jgi:hypothetical protein
MARDNYQFTDDDLLRFVRGHPWAYDFRHLRRPEGLARHLQAITARLCAEAETAWRSDLYLTRDEFIVEMAWTSKHSWWYWASQCRVIPFRVRFHVWPASSGCRVTGQSLVRGRDLPAIRDVLARRCRGSPTARSSSVAGGCRCTTPTAVGWPGGGR